MMMPSEQAMQNLEAYIPHLAHDNRQRCQIQPQTQSARGQVMSNAHLR